MQLFWLVKVASLTGDTSIKKIAGAMYISFEI